MKPKPYVGITGPINEAETTFICDEFHRAGYTTESPHIPMLGFLVSNKTLNGQNTSNRRYPKFQILSSMLEKSEDVLTMVHYNSRETRTLDEQISRLFRQDEIYDRELCQALQLNIPWPEPGQIKNIKEEFPDMKIVFQVSKGIIREKTPREIADGMNAYGQCISYYLIDPSGGEGKMFDIESSNAIYSEIKNSCPHLTPGFAGGLSGNNAIPVINELKEKTGTYGFSIDAEGGLRDKITSEYGDDILNRIKVRFYLSAASYVLK